MHFSIIVILYIIQFQNKLHQNTIMSIISIFMVCILVISFMMLHLNEFFTSFRKFFFWGNIIGIVLEIAYLISRFSILENVKMYEINHYFFIMYPYLLFWTILSFLANSKVSTFTNGIMTGITSCLDVAINWILDTKPDHLNQSQETISIFASQGFTCKQVAIMYIDSIIKPVLIINLILFMTCSIRSYWIEKYNHGIDITMATIENYSKRIVFKKEIKLKLQQLFEAIIIKILNFFGFK